MDLAALQDLEQLSAKELEQFKQVCNLLLARTFVFRTLYRPDKGRVNNPDYSFLLNHHVAAREYLSLLDWDLRFDQYNGYFYVVNADEANRLSLNQKQTAILLALRLIYEENMNRVGMENDVICTVQELLDKVVTVYAILSTKTGLKDVKQALTLFEQHSVIQRIEGKYTQEKCKFSILPTILIVVSSERLDAAVKMLRAEEMEGKEDESGEEADEDPAD